MELEQAIYVRLTNQPTVTAVLGDRVYPGQGPQSGAFPHLVYGQAEQQSFQTLTGRLKTNRYTMRLELWGDDYAELKRAWHAVRDDLVGFRGDLGDGVKVQGIFDQGGDDDAEAPQHAEEFGLWRAGLTLNIIYQRGA